jgi:hypothetical protein
LTEPKLWAGKYKSPEDLEEGYNKIRNTYTENQELKKQLQSFTTVPDDYQTTDVGLRQEQIQELKQIAKNAGLNQDQFFKTAKEMQDRINYQFEILEQRKKEIGEKDLNLLTDYVSKQYPEKLQETVLNKIIKDKEAMTEAMNHRSKILNSQVPGMDTGTGQQEEKYSGQKELVEAAKAHHKDPRNNALKERYIKIAAEVGNERFKK